MNTVTVITLWKKQKKKWWSQHQWSLISSSLMAVMETWHLRWHAHFHTSSTPWQKSSGNCCVKSFPSISVQTGHVWKRDWSKRSYKIYQEFYCCIISDMNVTVNMTHSKNDCRVTKEHLCVICATSRLFTWAEKCQKTVKIIIKLRVLFD